MVTTGVAKSSAYGIMGVLLWITANLGVAFYVLMAAYIIDFALHYSQKADFLQRMTLYLASTFFSYYLQNTQQFMSIPLLHGLIVAMAVHEVVEVLTEARTRLDVLKKKNPAQAPEIDQLEQMMAQFQAILPQLAAAQAIQNPVNTPAPPVPTPPTPKGGDEP